MKRGWEGCPERLDLSFFRWIWGYAAEQSPGTRLEAALHLRIIELHSTAEVSTPPSNRVKAVISLLTS